jgi:hypothetical protein
MNCTRLASILSLMTLTGLAGCDSTADKQREADQAQAAADQKRAAAEEQAQQKAAEAQNAAQQTATEAQRKADDKLNAAIATLGKEQLESLTAVNGAIQDLAGKIDDLNTAANAEVKPDKRAADDHVIDDLQGRRNGLIADARAITEATTMTWPALKDKVDKDMGDYRSLVRVASVSITHAPR